MASIEERRFEELLDILANARRDQKMTLVELAEKIGVHENSVSRWERRVDSPKFLHVLLWVRALGLDLKLVGKYEGSTW